MSRRVAAARRRQAARYADLPPERRIPTNAEADGALLDDIAAPDPDGRALLVRAADRLRLSARGYHRVMRIARTLGRPRRRGPRRPPACRRSAELPPPAHPAGKRRPPLMRSLQARSATCPIQLPPSVRAPQNARNKQ